MTRSFLISAIGFAAATLVVAGSGPSLAAPPAANNVVAARQANFKKMGAAMKTIKDALRGGAPSKPVIVGAATALAQAARPQARLFPNGSGPAAGVKTDALAGIWTNRATFDQQMKAMTVQADRLVQVAQSGDMAGIEAQYGALGGTCGSCHRQFRADN